MAAGPCSPAGYWPLRLLMLVMPWLNQPWLAVAGTAVLGLVLPFRTVPAQTEFLMLLPQPVAVQGGLEPCGAHDGPVLPRAGGVGRGDRRAGLHVGVRAGLGRAAGGFSRRASGVDRSHAHTVGRAARVAVAAGAGAVRDGVASCRDAAHDADRLPDPDGGGLLRGVRAGAGGASLRHAAAGRRRSGDPAGRAVRGHLVPGRVAGCLSARRNGSTCWPSACCWRRRCCSAWAPGPPHCGWARH
jgi:hypothetical protein